MRVALAGVGHWHAGMHADAVRAAGARIAAVWDPAPGVAERVAAREGGVAMASMAALLADRPDLVVVMGDPREVPETARAVVAAGVPMVLEKPAAVDTAALAAIAPAGFVAVPLANRMSPIWGARGEGVCVHAHFRIVNGLPGRYRADGVGWMLDPAVAGGGALRNLGLHAVDAALLLFGDRAVRVRGAEVRFAHGEAVEDYAVATLTAEGGPVVIVEAGYTVPTLAAGGDFSWRVADRGAFYLDDGTTSRVTTLEGTRTLEHVPQGARYRAFMADTLACLREGRAPSAGFEDYLRAMRLVDAIYAEAGR